MIMFTNLQSGATMLGLSAVMTLILGYILVKGAGNFWKRGYFWDPRPTLTEVDVNTIPLPAGPVDIAASPVSGSVYVATEDKSILLLDPKDNKIMRVQDGLAKSPIRIAPTSNRLIAILKKGMLARLDVNTLEITHSSAFEHPINAVAVNSSLHRAYLASERAKAVYAYDIDSDTIVKKIDLEHPPSSIAVDRVKGKVFVAYSNVAGVSVIDESSLEMIELIGFPVPGAAVSFSADVYVNPENHMVYVLLRPILLDGNSVGHELDSLYLFDGITKTFVDCRSCRLDWKSQALLSDDGHNYLAIDPKSGTVFLTSTSKKRLFALPPRGGDPLYSIKIGRGCSGIAVSQDGKKAYICYGSFFGRDHIDVISLGGEPQVRDGFPMTQA